ncbi:hypothetical protein BKP45_10205 [Anaerobacillus alkalidiazotrophicus]|uniref:Uncharacterized protein n=1 Tax=Anaerobacillus alkalidiazotrophicus TaxID=472963 RepID=A0A1S2M5W5_9BACI|nr:hypothetical protein [Anaerobacillus alkalidiazotrophicus]OIJ20148.1 hypothetical protein BKP45_10205 [Anaerobacillus alkalidiazotrophicus]
MNQVKRLTTSVPGNFYVTSACINYDQCRQIAPHTFSEVANLSNDLFLRGIDPTSKLSVGGNFHSGGVETPSEFSMFSEDRTSSLESINSNKDLSINLFEKIISIFMKTTNDS